MVQIIHVQSIHKMFMNANVMFLYISLCKCICKQQKWCGQKFMVFSFHPWLYVNWQCVILCKHALPTVPTFKVFWSSGRPLLCFSRFWPSENVARIRHVYVAYSQTKRVHTRNIASNAKGKCVFCFDCAKWSHYFIHRGALAARTKFHDVSTNEKRKV